MCSFGRNDCRNLMFGFCMGALLAASVIIMAPMQNSVANDPVIQGFDGKM